MKSHYTRIIFEYRQNFYKFLNFWVDKKESDSSFYFHFYDDVNNKIKIPKTPIEQRDHSKIDFNDYVETDFKREHLSIHQSGLIHSKDKDGNRLRDGIVGFSFDEIEISKLVLVCAPKEIQLLTPYHKSDKTKDLLIHLNDNIQPFTLHFEVFRKSKASELDISNPNLLFGGFIVLEIENKEFGLRIYGQYVLGKPFWPPFNLILTQIKNNKA